MLSQIGENIRCVLVREHIYLDVWALFDIGWNDLHVVGFSKRLCRPVVFPAAERHWRYL